MLRLILFSLSSLLFCSIAWANDLLIYYTSNESSQYSNLKSHYEGLGFTVTGSTSTTVSSTDVSGKEMVIDITGNSNCGSTCRSVYDTYVSGGGILIIAAENGATNRISNIESLIENKMQVGSYTAVVNGNDAYQSFRSGNYAGSTSNLDTLPGVDGYMYSITGGEVVASNTSINTTYQTWHKWDYGTNGGAVYVTFGYGQFLSTNSYSDNMDSLLTAIVTEEGLYTSTSSGSSSATPSYSSGATSAQQTRINSHTSNVSSGGANDITVDIDGDDNNVYITQTGEPSYLLLNVTGNLNDVDIDQNASTATTYGHYLEADIIGNSNILDITQTGSGQKSAFINYEGNSNDATIIQKDGGSHYLMLDLIGDGNDATITQEGSGSHEATVELTENGGAWTFMLNQSGTTDKTYSLPHSMSDGSTISGTCSTTAGCSLTVNQGD